MSHFQGISVLFATYRRGDVLRDTLRALAELNVGDLSWEVIVVDNAGDEATSRLCEQFSASLPLRPFVCTTPGKNAALNYGLRHVQGDLVVLTDDDVIPDREWLREMRLGADRWPEHVLFGGRVLPRWPEGPPPLDLSSRAIPHLAQWSYSVYDPPLPEGPMTGYPLGPNMAVRRSAFDAGLRFDERIGPRGANYAMGSETELIRRLRKAGESAVFLPSSSVWHQIRPEQMRVEWLIGRAFREGRGRTRLQGEVTWPQTLRMAVQATRSALAYYRALAAPGHHSVLERRIVRSLTQGQLYEAMRMRLGRD